MATFYVSSFFKFFCPNLFSFSFYSNRMERPLHPKEAEDSSTHPEGREEESTTTNFGWCCFFSSPFGWCCLASSFFDVVLLSPLPCVPSFRLVLLFLRSFRWCCLPLLLLGWWYHSVRHHTTRHYATAQHPDTAPHLASYNDADHNNFSDLSQFTWIFVGEHFEHNSN